MVENGEMTVELGGEEWVGRLAAALEALLAAQRPYDAEIELSRAQRAFARRHEVRWGVWDHPSLELWMFYGRAYSEGQYFEERYGPLREALDQVHQVVAGHPAISGAITPSASGGEFWLQMVTGGGIGYLTSIVGGLAAHASRLGRQGCRVAATELRGLLEEDIDGPLRKHGRLTMGYHVAVFHGLRIDEAIPLEGDVRIVLIGKLEDFVDGTVLNDFLPHRMQESARKAIGAIVKPFRWKPEFRKKGGDDHRELDWGGSFLEDAEDLIQLLAVLHELPLVCLAKIPYCVSRTATHLLGQVHYHGTYTRGRSARNVGVRSNGGVVDMKAVDRARRTFGTRGSSRYQDCAPMLGRLAEALARSGQFRVDDRILDVAIALERMYDLDQGEITFKLRTRAACFLEDSTAGRRRVFNDVGEFYAARSSIVHKRAKGGSGGIRSARDNKEATFSKGFAIAQRTIVKLLESGWPSDWNDVVIEGVKRGDRN